MPDTTTPVIVDPHGQPLRAPVTAACVQCGAGPDRRLVVNGFGPPRLACGNCGHDVAEPTR